MLRAGDLRQRVTLEQRTQQSDGHDGFVEAWLPLYRRMPARVQPLQGRDLERAQQLDPRISHQVTLRYWRNYRADLDGGRTRLVWHDVGEVSLELVAPPVDQDARHEALTLLCREAA